MFGRERPSDANSPRPRSGVVNARSQEVPTARLGLLLKREDVHLVAAIDKALDQDNNGSKPEATLASPQEESAREQQQALQQWLQRIPDDPGGLLRRKFQLEYDRRQRGEGDGG